MTSVTFSCNLTLTWRHYNDTTASIEDPSHITPLDMAYTDPETRVR